MPQRDRVHRGGEPLQLQPAVPAIGQRRAERIRVRSGRGGGQRRQRASHGRHDPPQQFDASQPRRSRQHVERGEFFLLYQWARKHHRNGLRRSALEPGRKHGGLRSDRQWQHRWLQQRRRPHRQQQHGQQLDQRRKPGRRRCRQRGSRRGVVGRQRFGRNEYRRHERRRRRRHGDGHRRHGNGRRRAVIR